MSKWIKIGPAYVREDAITGVARRTRGDDSAYIVHFLGGDHPLIATAAVAPELEEWLAETGISIPEHPPALLMHATVASY